MNVEGKVVGERELVHAQGQVGVEAQAHTPAWLTPAQAGEIIGVSARRIVKLCGEGRIPATRIGCAWAIARADAEAFAKVERKPGRPRSAGQG
jgi:excisionase family DNA binding protein